MNAERVLDHILSGIARADVPRPGIFALPDGGTLIEWSSPGEVRSIEITPDGAVELLELASGSANAVQRVVSDITEAIRFARRTA